MVLAGWFGGSRSVVPAIQIDHHLIKPHDLLPLPTQKNSSGVPSVAVLVVGQDLAASRVVYSEV